MNKMESHKLNQDICRTLIDRMETRIELLHMYTKTSHMDTHRVLQLLESLSEDIKKVRGFLPTLTNE